MKTFVNKERDSSLFLCAFGETFFATSHVLTLWVVLSDKTIVITLKYVIIIKSVYVALYTSVCRTGCNNRSKCLFEKLEGLSSNNKSKCLLEKLEGLSWWCAYQFVPEVNSVLEFSIKETNWCSRLHVCPPLVCTVNTSQHSSEPVRSFYGFLKPVKTLAEVLKHFRAECIEALFSNHFPAAIFRLIWGMLRFELLTYSRDRTKLLSTGSSGLEKKENSKYLCHVSSITFCVIHSKKYLMTERTSNGNLSDFECLRAPHPQHVDIL